MLRIGKPGGLGRPILCIKKEREGIMQYKDIIRMNVEMKLKQIVSDAVVNASLDIMERDATI